MSYGADGWRAPNMVLGRESQPAFVVTAFLVFTPATRLYDVHRTVRPGDG